MQVKQLQKNQICPALGLADQIEDYDKQQLSEVYREIKQELTRYKPESLTTFQDWVTRIYKLKVKIADLGLEAKNIEFSISASDIEAIVNKILLETCEIHRHLIEEQLKSINEMGLLEGFFKVDADGPPVGYFDHLRNRQPGGEGTKLQASSTEPKTYLNEQYYCYCVWIIYNHYCSLAECNELVCELAKLFHETSENLFFRIFKEIQRKKVLGDTEETPVEEIAKGKTMGDSNQIRQIVSMVEDEEVVKLNQLNILTILNLIPSSIPSVLILEFEDEKDKNVLFWHICSFERTINTIIYYNKQNMRRFMVFLTNFKRALKILKDRLGKKEKQILTQDNLFPDTRDLKYFKRELNFSLFDQQDISSEIERKIDRERVSDEIHMEDEKSRSDEAELVRNIDELLEKEKSGKKMETKPKELRGKLDQKQPKLTEGKQVSRRSLAQNRRNNFSFRNSSFGQSTQNVESITRISAMLTQNNVESYKFEVIVKKNDKVIEKSGKGSYLSRESEDIEEKKRKIDFQLSELKMEKNLQKEIVEQLKHNLNSLIKNQLTKEEEFANYLKITEKHDKRRSPDSCQVNLHQFIQQSDFKNDDEESEGDENYLERMQSQHLENQRKKKKKKNKKKKNQKQEQIQETEIEKGGENPNGDSKSEKMKEIKPNLRNEVGEKEYEIILILENTKIDQENRLKCFDIDEEFLINMKKRQMEQLGRCCVLRQEQSVSKLKAKSKKHKAK